MDGPCAGREHRIIMAETKYKKREPVQSNIYGMLPPQATDLEEAVLGALMLERVPANIWSIVRPEMFYETRHQLICKSIFELRNADKPIDILTVKANLSVAGELERIGGAYYLTELTNRVSGAKNIEFHIAIIHEKFISRELIRMATGMVQSCYSDGADPLAEMGLMVAEMNNLKKGIFRRTDKTMQEVIAEAKTERKKPKKKGLLGHSTGSKGLDHILRGYQKNQFVVIAGRPGMAKTTEAISQALDLGYREKDEQKSEEVPTAFFSLEMSNVPLAYRALANISSIPTLKISSNELNEQEEQRLNYYEERLAKSQIYLDDTPGLTIDEFEAKAALLVATKGVQVIFIDYLQLMLGSPYKKYGTREEIVSDISRRLKLAAKNLDITVVALCQLSRAVENRANTLPQLSDLRESGSIEQDADVVILLWRPEYYEAIIDKLGEVNIDLFNFKLTEFKGLIMNIVAKCREQKTGKVPLKCDLSIMKVYDHPAVLDALQTQQHKLEYGMPGLIASQPTTEERKEVF